MKENLLLEVMNRYASRTMETNYYMKEGAVTGDVVQT